MTVPSYSIDELTGKGADAATSIWCGRMEGSGGVGGRTPTGRTLEVWGVETETGECGMFSAVVACGVDGGKAFGVVLVLAYVFDACA